VAPLPQLNVGENGRKKFNTTSNGDTSEWNEMERRKLNALQPNNETVINAIVPLIVQWECTFNV